MSKTELFEKAERLFEESIAKITFKNCNARYTTVYDYESKLSMFILQSYSTIVAVYIPFVNTIFVRDYYSNTTCQHISKFIKEYNIPKVLYCYNRSDNVVYKNGNNKFTKKHINIDFDYGLVMSDILNNRI